MPVDDPIEQQIDFLIDEIDAFMAGKYPFLLRDILEHPLDYRDDPTTLMDIERMKLDVSRYFDERLTELKDNITAYKADALKSTRLAEKLQAEVEAAAKTTKKPVIKPLTFARNEDEDQIIFVEQYEEGLKPALEAMAEKSLFVVDATIAVDEFKIGRWVFSNPENNYAVYVSFPVNPGAAIEIARDQMLIALDAVRDELQATMGLARVGPVPETMVTAPEAPEEEEAAPAPPKPPAKKEAPAPPPTAPKKEEPKKADNNKGKKK